MNSPHALVIYGDGINCENESAFALELAGFTSSKAHVSELLNSSGLVNYQASIILFPGGFSFGDEIASGKVLALKLRERLSHTLHKFIDSGRLVMGICNGFQVLVQLGILPDSQAGAESLVALGHNKSGTFINRWVDLAVSGSSSWFAGMSQIQLPIRHGEGRLIASNSLTRDQLEGKIFKQAPLRYKVDVNGSLDCIAGLTNQGGNVLGLMPHPEAFVRWSQHPTFPAMRLATGKRPAIESSESVVDSLRCRHDEFQSGDSPDGLTIFKNAFRMVKTV